MPVVFGLFAARGAWWVYDGVRHQDAGNAVFGGIMFAVIVGAYFIVGRRPRQDEGKGDARKPEDPAPD